MRVVLAIFTLCCLSFSSTSFAYQMSEEEHRAIRDFLQQSFDDNSSFVDKFDAEVWLLIQSNKLKLFIKDEKQRLELLKLVHQEAQRAKLNPDLVLAVIQVESAFNRYAVSSAGAQGLMQVMPFWRKEIGRDEDNLTQVLTNLQYGCRILQIYLQREKGNLMMALARYNGSYPKTWYSERVMNAWKGRWDSGIE